MSISKERREEIRKELRGEHWGIICDAYLNSKVARSLEDSWLDILDRELESQREKIVGDMKNYLESNFVSPCMENSPAAYGNGMVLTIINGLETLPSLTRDGGEAEGTYIKGSNSTATPKGMLDPLDVRSDHSK